MQNKIEDQVLVKEKIQVSCQLSCQQAIRAIAVLEQPKTQEFILKAASLIAETFELGGKVLLAGNGGSLCDALHVAEEFTGQFRKRRKALPAIALGEPGHITCVGNDYGFDDIFSRGVEAFGKPDDIFIALTTSGNSENLVRALNTAKSLGLKRIAFLGRGGGRSSGLSDLEICIDGFSTSDRIQEVHMALLHIIVEMVESILFGE